MRIAYVGPLPPIKGGISQHGARLVEALRGQGHSVTTYSWAAQYPSFLYRGDQRDVDVRAIEGAEFSLRWWNPVSWWKVGRAARRSELLVFPWVTPFVAPSYRVILAAGPRTSLAIVHNPVPHERSRFDVALARWVLAKVKGAVVDSRASARKLSLMVPDIRIEVVPLPPNLPVEAEDLPDHPPVRLLFFGLIRPYKGLDVALDALKILVARGVPVSLTIAGEFWGPVEPWREKITSSGLAPHVDLRPGYVEDDQVQRLIARHHLVLAPYRAPTASAIVPLAHAVGRPVVATAVDGLLEYVADGVNGIVAPPGDAPAFADAVANAIEKLPQLAASARLSPSTWSDVAAAVTRLAS